MCGAIRVYSPVPGGMPRACSSASMNSSASAKRNAGSFCSARITTSSSWSETAGLKSDGGTGSSLTCFKAIVTADSASNGTRPVSSSYRTTPIE